MPGSLVEFDIKGIEALVAKLEALTPFLRRKFVLKALYKGAAHVQRAAAEPIVAVPVLRRPEYRHGKLYRTPGTLQRAIKIRTSREATRHGDVGVFVNVKPAKGGDRGANSPNDPFYWRFIQFSTKRSKARPFLSIGAQQLTGPALRAIEESLSPDLKQLNLPGIVK